MLSFKVNHLRHWLPLAIYHLIVVVLVVANFPLGQWLLGWDGLYPELNLPLNISRGLQAVWQEQYGVGVFGGHGFAATLLHSLIIGLLSLALPVWALRSTFTLLCFYLGGLGFYIFSLRLLREATQRKPLLSIKGFAEGLALTGTLVYLFNLGTTQMFYIQLEAFIVQFAALPWLFWGVLTIFKRPSRKNWFGLLAIAILSSIQGFIPQIFLVTLVALGIFLGGVVMSQPTWERLKRGALVLLVVLVGNAYWLLPFGYYALGHNQTFLAAYNNLVSTPDFIAKSFQYGSLKNAALLKGFYWEGYQLGEYVFAPWWAHHSQDLIPFLGYGFFGLAILGLIFSWFWVRNWKIIGLGVGALVGFAGLGVDIWPISEGTTWLYQHSNLFAQAFRTTFTKFSFLTAFGLAFFLMMGVAASLAGFKKLKARLSVLVVTLVTLMTAALVYGLPSFRGHFFYSHLKVDLPEPYIELITFFNQLGEGRVADFPQACPEGWSTYDWGYLGSGFLWYGVKQPLLTRSSDVWSNFNEAYFWEVRAALQAEDFSRLDQVLAKYRIRWLMYDQNVLHCRNLKALKHNQKWLEYLDQTSQYSKIAEFSGEGIKPISVYERQPEPIIEAATDLPNLGPEYSFANQDQAYQDYGTYVTRQDQELAVYYPFRSLFSGRDSQRLHETITDDEETIDFFNQLPEESSRYRWSWPEMTLGEEDLGGWASASPSVQLDDGVIKIQVDKQTSGFYYRSDQDEKFWNQEVQDCSLSGEGGVGLELVQEGDNQFWRLQSTGSNSCLTKELSSWPHELGYLIKVGSRNIQGDGLLFSVTDQTTQELVLKTYLPDKLEPTVSYFILPPQEEHGLGYSLRWENIARGRQEVINDLGQVEVWPVPVTWLKQIKLVANEPAVGKLQPVEYQKGGIWFYQAVAPPEATTPVFHQGYDLGWKAFYFEGVKPVFLDQVLVNNWANGWEVDPAQEKVVYIIFWPQLLEFVGLGMLAGLIILLITSSNLLTGILKE